jgi:hypothetical protein
MDEAGNLLYTFTTANQIKIYSAGVIDVSGTAQVYCFAENKIHKANVAFTTVTESLKTITGNNKHPIVEANNSIYYGTSSQLRKLNQAEDDTLELQLPWNEQITGLTFFQDLFTIYTSGRVTSTYNITGMGVQYKWYDGNASYTYRQVWEGLPVQKAISVGGTDYIITGATEDYTDLYMVIGTEKQLVRSNLEGGGRKFLPVMCNRLEDVYIGAKIDAYAQTLRYGKYFPNLPTAFTPDFGLENDVVFISTYGNQLAIAVKNTSDTYQLKYYDLKNHSVTKYETTGEIRSNWIDFGTRRERKTINEMKIALDPYNVSEAADGNLTLYARKSKADAWTQFCTFDVTDVNEYTLSVIPSFGDFYKVEFRVELLGNTNHSPVLREIEVRYTTNVSA